MWWCSYGSIKSVTNIIVDMICRRASFEGGLPFDNVSPLMLTGVGVGIAVIGVAVVGCLVEGGIAVGATDVHTSSNSCTTLPALMDVIIKDKDSSFSHILCDFVSYRRSKDSALIIIFMEIIWH